MESSPKMFEGSLIACQTGAHHPVVRAGFADPAEVAGGSLEACGLSPMTANDKLRRDPNGHRAFFWHTKGHSLSSAVLSNRHRRIQPEEALSGTMASAQRYPRSQVTWPDHDTRSLQSNGLPKGAHFDRLRRRHLGLVVPWRAVWQRQPHSCRQWKIDEHETFRNSAWRRKNGNGARCHAW